MNHEWERCCKVSGLPCELDFRAERTKTKLERGEFTPEDGSREMSVLSQQARKVDCPKGDILSSRRKIAAATKDPNALHRVNTNAQFIPGRPFSEDDKASFPIGLEKPGARTFGKDRR